MNRKTIVNSLGKIMVVMALLMVIPLLISLGYGEFDNVLDFIIVIVPTLIIGLLCTRVKGTKLSPRDGFLIVTFAWIVISLIGADALFLSDAYPDYISALFETVSGFTTTGASVMPDPGVLGHGMQFFRCFSHWIGGMGVLVFVLMLVPMENDSSMHLVRAEVPGPTAGKLVPRMKNTSRILYGIYGAMTFVLFLILVILKMPVFDAICYSFGTAGTGGFGINSAGFAIYENHAAIEVVISIFMLLFGVNFNLYYFLLLKKFKEFFKSEELRFYFIIVVTAVITMSFNIYNTIVSIGGTLGDTVRIALFQVSSIVTTTGFSTYDFTTFPQYSQHVLALFMITGACAGSTAGGFKLSRVIILFKSFIAEIRYMINPKQMVRVRLDGSVVDDKTLRSVRIYCAAYFIIICVSVLLLSIDGQDFTTNVTAVLACFNNIGPGLGKVGPCSNYSFYSGPAKALLSLLMLMGRLEIFPLFMIFAPSAHDRI